MNLFSEQLSAAQLRLFAQELNAGEAAPETLPETHKDKDKDEDDLPPGSDSSTGDREASRPRGRRPLPRT
jgi:hypothetical protein